MTGNIASLILDSISCVPLFIAVDAQFSVDYTIERKKRIQLIHTFIATQYECIARHLNAGRESTDCQVPEKSARSHGVQIIAQHSQKHFCF